MSTIKWKCLRFFFDNIISAINDLLSGDTHIKFQHRWFSRCCLYNRFTVNSVTFTPYFLVILRFDSNALSVYCNQYYTSVSVGNETSSVQHCQPHIGAVHPVFRIDIWWSSHSQDFKSTVAFSPKVSSFYDHYSHLQVY